MKEKKYHHGDLRNALVEAAIALLREQGAEALSLRAVAARAGVSHMAPYSHFKNKKQLLQSIAAWGFKELAKRMLQDAEQQSDADELVLSYGTTYVTFALENPQLYRLMLGQVDTAGRRNSGNDRISVAINQPGLSEELDECAKRPFGLLSDAFSQRITNPEQVTTQALGAWSLVHGMAALLIEGHFTIPEHMSIKGFLAQAVIRAPLNQPT